MKCYFDINDETDEIGTDMSPHEVPDMARRLMLAVVMEEGDKGGGVTLVVRDESHRELYRAWLRLAGGWAMDAQPGAVLH
jgi:hypothetical protein